MKYKVEPASGYTGGAGETSLGEFTINKANGWVSLSPSSASGFGSPFSTNNTGVNRSHHGGTLSYSKSGASAQNANVSISGNTMIVSKNNMVQCHGTTVTVTSAATTNYNAASATFTCEY